MATPSVRPLSNEHPAIRAARLAPFDDEPETARERAEAEAARNDPRSYSLDEVAAELGINLG